MATGIIQTVIGFAGAVGFFLRFIGPLTIAPTITLMGISLFSEAAESAGIKSPQIMIDKFDQTLYFRLNIWFFFLFQANTGEFQ